MNFKNYIQESQDIQEGIIVPPKLKIKTNDITSLNKQFKGHNPEIKFKRDTGTHGEYIPALDQIIIYVDTTTEADAIEVILQHEIIHSIQDKKSGMRMAQDIQKQQQEITDLCSYVDDLDDDEVIDPKKLQVIMSLRQKLQVKMEFLNHEEEMTYAYMYAKMYKKLGFKKALKNLQDEWKEWTTKKPSNRMLKYFAMYWQLKDQL